MLFCLCCSHDPRGAGPFSIVNRWACPPGGVSTRGRVQHRVWSKGVCPSGSCPTLGGVSMGACPELSGICVYGIIVAFFPHSDLSSAPAGTGTPTFPAGIPRWTLLRSEFAEGSPGGSDGEVIRTHPVSQRAARSPCGHRKHLLKLVVVLKAWR